MKEDSLQDIMSEINKRFRQELRRIGFKKNVVPVKFILPRNYIEVLLENPTFKKAWLRKTVYLKDKSEGKLRAIETYPNLGGIPVEEGLELEVIVEVIPRRKRLKGE